MTYIDAATDTLKHLEDLAAGGTLPPKIASQARALLKRAKSPVVVAVLGLPESGKSQLINLLAGEEILSGDIASETVRIGFGETKRTIVISEDGTKDIRDGIDLSVASVTTPKEVSIEFPSAMFKQINLVETALSGSAELLHDTFDRAVEAADIILWCSQEFSDDEYALWERVPDAKKDHSFMVLTKADLLSEQCVLSETIETTQVAVAEEFHSLIPVATVQAVKANQTGDLNALKASGGEFLVKAVMDHVKTGQRADLDSATLFLNRHSSGLLKSDDVLPESPIEASVPNEGTLPGNVALGTDRPISAAIVHLQQSAEAMVRSETSEDEKAAYVLDHCVSTSAKLAEIILENADDSPKYGELVGDVMEASDVIQLMQMESGLGAAVDAVTVLLQLRRGFEANIAA